MLRRVGDRFLRDPVQQGPHVGIRFLRHTVDDPHDPVARLRSPLEVDAERGNETLPVERGGTELEEHRAEPLDRRMDLRFDPGDRIGGDRVGELGEHLQTHVDGAHHLDRIVMDVRRDPLALRLLSVLQAPCQLATLLKRPAEHIEAPPELLLGLLAIGDVQHHTAPIQERAVQPADRRGFVADPDGPAVLRDDAVLIEIALRVAVGFLVRERDPVAIVWVDRLPPQPWIRHPLLDGVPEQRFDLRTGVEVRRQFIGPVEVEDRRDALHEHPVGVRVQLGEAPGSVLAHTLAITPASSAIRGTTLSRSSHSSRPCAAPPTGPSPSRVGQPAALVVFPSEAPPVAASDNANPSSFATDTASSTKRRDASVFSIGGCHPSGWTEIVTPSVRGWAHTASMARFASWSVASSGARRSTASTASSAPSFDLVPPRRTPTLHVTPGHRPWMPAISIALCAASMTALRPSSGSTPACAARPWIRIAYS